MALAVVVSYSWKDGERPEFRALQDDLAGYGADLWYDQKPRGDVQWWRDITGRIARCDVMVVVVSDAYLRSRACRVELQYALDCVREVVPVALDPVPMALLPRALQEAQVVDYSQSTAGLAQARTCVARLHQMLRAVEVRGARPPKDPPPPVPEVPLPFGHELSHYVDAPSLTMPEQEAMLAEVRRLAEEDDDGALTRTLEVLLDRDDLSWRVRPQLDEVVRSLRTGKAVGEGPAGGAATVTQGERPEPRTQPDGGETRRYRAPRMRLSAVADDIARFLDKQGLETAVDRDADGGFVLTSAPASQGRRLMGSGAGLTTKLLLDGDSLVVTITGERWADKGLSFAGGMVATVATGGWGLPLVAPSLVGAYRQSTLPRKIFEHVAKLTA